MRGSTMGGGLALSLSRGAGRGHVRESVACKALSAKAGRRGKAEKDSEGGSAVDRTRRVTRRATQGVTRRRGGRAGRF